MNKKPKTAYEDTRDVGRRDFFGQLFRELARPIAEFREGMREDEPEADEQPWLRPPSVSDEVLFLDTCDRSGECVTACPANAIQKSDDGTPIIDPTYTPCVVCRDLACMSACPSGALTPKPATELGIGVAKVDHDVCVRSQGEECTLCVQSCPVQQMGSRVIEVTLRDRIHVYEEACVGCGCCVRACPTEPKAMRVLPTRLLTIQ
ncbi:MAG: 4Fe-4S binding protein [Candidatus Poribacteria bacterium]|nr:4Fe-4S binding protein [Candidatus Poribacteria bacterium]